MYTSFTARHFLCFQDLNVAPLAQINLISGKNNAGSRRQGAGGHLPGGYTDGGLEEPAERFANLTVAKQEEQVVRLLQIVEPRLQCLAVQNWGGLPISYGDIGLARLIPLPLMGLTFTHILAGLACIANVPGTDQATAGPRAIV